MRGIAVIVGRSIFRGFPAGVGFVPIAPIAGTALKDGEVLDVDISAVRPLEEAVKDGIPFLFRMSTRAWKKQRARAYRHGR